MYLHLPNMTNYSAKNYILLVLIQQIIDKIEFCKSIDYETARKKRGVKSLFMWMRYNGFHVLENELASCR